ncbi:MAG: hypothetical protein K8T10_10015 [Candidatus Eremiobacteraeota bacterium]|nr:hypothetical protein [Candidatus Eremiobacteraeota bacterium]
MQNESISNNKEQALTVLAGTKAVAKQFIAKDNTQEDKDPKKGSVVITQNEDTTSLNAKLHYDSLPGQMNKLQDMSISYKHPNGEETASYGRIPDSETEMVSMKSTSENKEVAVVVNKQEGIYMYDERKLNS